MFHQLKKFAGGGLAGTICHYLILWGMVGRHVDPVIASGCGVVAGAAVVYLTNYYVTFSSARPHVDALKRFLPMAVAGFFLNGWILSGAMSHLSFPLVPAQLCATAGQFLFGFFISRLWVY